MDLQNQIQGMQKSIILKADIKDVCTLLDAKPNTENINQALT